MGKKTELETKIKSPKKYKWEIPANITLMPIVGVNHRLPILHLSKEWYIFIPHVKLLINFQFITGLTLNLSLAINLEHKLKNTWVILFLLRRIHLS